MLRDNNIEITFDWKENANIDLIYCHDPRPNDQGIWYQHFLDHQNRFQTPIIQRVGDVGTHGKPELTELVKQATQYSNKVIFPSLWAKEYVGYADDNTYVIPNAPLDIFYKNRKSKFELSGPIKVVTHHWSTNERKGFSIYNKLAEYCKSNSDKVSFSYAGRYKAPLPIQGISFHEPMDAIALSRFLPRHDLYLTASEEEAGANHVLEAMAAGIPVLYSSSGGSIPEYCKMHGVMYDGYDDMINKINTIANRYQDYSSMSISYDYDISKMLQLYKKVFLSSYA